MSQRRFLALLTALVGTAGVGFSILQSTPAPPAAPEQPEAVTHAPIEPVDGREEPARTTIPAADSAPGPVRSSSFDSDEPLVFAGRVVDTNGDPVPGATVRVRVRPGGGFAGGRCEFETVAHGRYRIASAKDHFVQAELQIDLAGDRELTLELQTGDR
jgi:hypothetical protein